MKYKVGDRVIAYDNAGRNKQEDRHIGVIVSVPIGLTFPYKVRYVDSGETLWSEVIGYAKLPVNVEHEQKYYNGKVMCIKSGYPWWTVGKVYNVVDGFITDDFGDLYPDRGIPYADAKDVRHAGFASTGRHDQHNEFVPLVEE